PIDPRRVYLAVGTYTNEWTSQNGTILRSSNYGQTFQRFDLPFKVGGNMPGRNMGERLAIDPNNNSILYLGTRSGHGLWRSTDPPNAHFGYCGLSVAARNPNVLVVAALNSWWPDTIIFRSLDAGSTWDRIWNFGSWPTITTNYTLSYASVAPWLTFGDTPSPCTSSQNLNALCPQPTPKLGWMVGSLEIDPFNSNRILYGTGATLFGTNNLTAWDTGGQ